MVTTPERRKYLSDLYYKWKAAGLCTKCGKPDTDGLSSCSTCRAQAEARAKARLANGQCAGCTRVRCKESVRFCAVCYQKRTRRTKSPEYKAKNRIKRRAFYASLRARALAIYGDKCACCSELNTRFLTFDHINNDGNIQRKHRRSSVSSKGYYILIRTRPTDIQLLCFNCNMGKAMNGGICPHQSISSISSSSPSSNVTRAQSKQSPDATSIIESGKKR